MATADQTSDLLTSSDSLELFCDPCLEDGNNVQAEGYCVDCANHLCVTCFQHHRRPKVWRHHQLLDKQQMPQTKSDKVYKDECTDKCPTHKDEILKYFCEDHKEFGCTVCVTLGHKTCNVGYIPTLSDKLFERQEYKTFKSDIEALSRKADSIQSAATQNLTDVQNLADKVLSEIRDMRRVTNEYFDELEKNISEKVARIKNEDECKIEAILKECNKVSAEVTELHRDIMDKEGKNLTCPLFADTIKKQDCIKKHEQNFNRMKRNNKIREMAFLPSTRVLSLIHDKSHILGSLVCLHQSFPVVTDTDKKDTCRITDISVLSNGRIAVTDSCNECIKIIDTKEERVIMSKSLPGYSSGITAVSDDQIAVPLNGNIEIFSVKDQIELKKTIKNPGLKWTIFYTNNMFIGCTQQSPTTVRMINMNGEVLKTFPAEINGVNLFENLRYVVVNSDCTAVYISDWGKQTVICMTFEGEVKAQYKPTNGWSPIGIASSRDGTVYVCDFRNNSIHVLSSDLQEICVIDCSKYGIKSLRGLGYCDRERKLYVGMWDNTDMVVLTV